MKNFERVIDIIVGIIIMFLVPFLYFSQGHDRLLQEMIKLKTSEFTDLIETQGYISKNMYEGFLQNLSTANVMFDVSIEHQELVYEPEYRLRTPDEIIEEQDNAYSGENTYTYIPVHTEKPIVNDPIDTNGLNQDSNESVLAGAINRPASTTHVHNDACYNGATKHIHQGNSSNGGACYKSSSGGGTACGAPRTLSVSRSPSGAAKCTTNNCTGWKDVTQITESFICTWGHNSSAAHYYVSCSTCGVTGYENLHQNWIPSNTGVPCSQVNSTPSYTLSCSKNTTDYYMGDKAVGMVCHLMIESITPTHPVQKVQQGMPIITTVNITYKDGSTKVVVCNTTYSSSSIVQNKNVTLTHKYTIWNVTYENTGNIIITVIPKNKTCVKGHAYNLKADGGDPGCPYCKAWLLSLVIAYPSSGNLTIYKGKTLQESGVGLLATYLDGRSEYVYDGYVDNLDRNYVGTQRVTLGYKGKTITLTVITNRNLVKCNVCKLDYELYPDGSDPSCPYCAARTPIFTGNVLTYYQLDTEHDIVASLYEGDGRYNVREGDYLSILVRNRGETLGGKILGLTIPGIETTRIRVQQGGMVRDTR